MGSKCCGSWRGKEEKRKEKKAKEEKKEKRNKRSEVEGESRGEDAERGAVVVVCQRW